MRKAKTKKIEKTVKTAKTAEPGKRRWVKWVAIFAVLLLFACICASFVFSVYNGYIHINDYSASKYDIHGVDVSHYQGEIDWNKLASQDVRFAYIKATEGSSHVDDKFAVNYKDAQEAGIRVGAYHFFSYDSAGATQAENFINTVDACEGMMPPVADVEFYGDKNSNPPKAEDVRRELGDFLDALEETYGMKPAIYTTEDLHERYIKGYFDEYPLWIRSIWSTPDRDINWTFWQYTDRGRLEGFSGDETFIDLNVFYGTADEWESWPVK